MRFGGRRLLACVAAAVAGTALLLAAPTTAWAHGDEANESARDLVLTAIAILEAHPGGMHLADDKVNDALASKQTKGVNLDLVRQAKTALDAEDLARTTVLLEQAVGACPGAPVLYVPSGPRTPPPGGACPEPQHVRGVPAGSVGSTAKIVLLVLAAAMAAVGGFLLTRIH